MKFCVSTDVRIWTNWSTFEPDLDHSPDAGTGKSEIDSRSNRHLTQSRLQVDGCTVERYCLLHVVVQGPGSFSGHSTFWYDRDVRLRSYAATWAKTRRILNMDDPNPLTHLDYHGQPGQLPDCINNFFVSVSAHLPKADPSILTLTDDYCTDYVVEPADVEYRLAHINIFKAPGPDSLPSWLLRDFAPFLCQPLAAIFNASIREGYVPPI